MYQLPKLRLNSTRDLYHNLKTRSKIINFLIYGFIYWIEESVIDYKVKSSIDVALIRYKSQLPEASQSPWSPPEVTETYEDPDLPLPTLRASYKWVEKETENPD